jgi:hypothetical protein
MLEIIEFLELGKGFPMLCLSVGIKNSLANVLVVNVLVKATFRQQSGLNHLPKTPQY